MTDGQEQKPQSRGTIQAMPRAEMLAELGDAVVDDSTLAQLDELHRRSGEPSSTTDDLEAILKNPRPFAEDSEGLDLDKLPETQHKVDEQEPQTSEPKRELTLDEKFEIHKARIDAEVEARNRQIAAALTKAAQPSPPPPPPPKAPEFMKWTSEQLEQIAEKDPFMAEFIQTQQRTYQLEQEVYQLRNERNRDVETKAVSEFDAAYKFARENYPELDKYLQPELMRQAREQVRQARTAGADFNGWFKHIYTQQAMDDILSGKLQTKVKAQQPPNELDTKRKEAIRKTQVVSSGGGAYQPPEAKSTDRSLRGGAKDMVAELKQMGFR